MSDMTTAGIIERLERREPKTGPRDNKGRLVPINCPDPNCSAGRLRFESYIGAQALWCCDGLVAPEDPSRELECCPYSHIDGESALRPNSNKGEG